MNYRVVERLLSALTSTGRYPRRLCAATVMTCVNPREGQEASGDGIT
jgi:hypothetical protein